jgi:hypothetical protein
LLGGMALHETCLPPALLGFSTFAGARATHLLLCSPFHLTVVASFCFILCRSHHASPFLLEPPTADAGEPEFTFQDYSLHAVVRIMTMLPCGHPPSVSYAFDQREVVTFAKNIVYL